MQQDDETSNKSTCPECGRSFTGEFFGLELSYHRKIEHGIELPVYNRPFFELERMLGDRTRDNLCAELRAIGLDAKLAKSGRPEENTGSGSLGLIIISQSLIILSDISNCRLLSKNCIMIT